MQQGIARKSNKFHLKHTEVVWHTRRQEVLDEIVIILKLDEATTKTPGWFQARTPAIKNIIQRMTPAQRAWLDEEVAGIASTGYAEN